MHACSFWASSKEFHSSERSSSISAALDNFVLEYFVWVSNIFTSAARKNRLNIFLKINYRTFFTFFFPSLFSFSSTKQKEPKKYCLLDFSVSERVTHVKTNRRFILDGWMSEWRKRFLILASDKTFTIFHSLVYEEKTTRKILFYELNEFFKWTQKEEGEKMLAAEVVNRQILISTHLVILLSFQLKILWMKG